MHENLVQVPGTPYVVLKDDTALGKWAVENGSIIGETHIRDLPEVQALGPDDVLIDCGAFYDTPIIFAERGCRVIAFEPYHDAAAALRINAAQFPNIEVYEVAVGDGSKLTPMGRACENNGNAGTRMVSRGGPTCSLRIDDFPLEKLTGVKVDVEGVEMLVLNGARKTIERFKPWLLVEVYDVPLKMQGFTRDDIFRFMDSIGYQWRVAIGFETDERFDLLATPK